MIDAIREKTLKRLFDYTRILRFENAFSDLFQNYAIKMDYLSKKKKETTERSLDRTYFKPNVVIKVCLFPQARS